MNDISNTSDGNTLDCACDNSSFNCSDDNFKWSNFLEYKKDFCVHYLGTIYRARRSHEGIKPAGHEVSFIFWEPCGICPTPTPTPTQTPTVTPTPTITPSAPLGIVYSPCQGLVYTPCEGLEYVACQQS